MMAQPTDKVVVWEWNEQGHWRPYDSAVSNHIEQQLQQQSRHVQLGQADQMLSCYIVDLIANVQIRQDTGNQRPVRRQLYPADSPAGRGIAWQWSGDIYQQWCNYGLEVACILEEAFCRHQQIINLSQTPCRLPYTIDFHKMQQTRNETGFIRQVKRVKVTNMAYTKTNNAQVNVFSMQNGSVASSATNHLNRAIAVPGTSFGQNLSRGKSKLDTGPGDMHSPKKMTRSHLRKQATSTVTPQNMAAMMNGGPVSMFPAYSSQGLLNSTLNLSTSGSGASGASNMRGKRLSPAMSGMTSMLMSPAVPLAGSSMASSYSLTSFTSQNSIPGYGVYDLPPKQQSGSVKPEEALQKFTEVVANPPKDEDCSICFESLQEKSSYADEQSSTAEQHMVWKLNKCDHMFHMLCILTMYNSGTKADGLQCPSCKTIYGEKQGNCPAGRMEYQILQQSLPGHHNCGTICITYTIHPGIQGPDHPNPGQRYSTYGFPRVCYLPDDNTGRKILKLLVKAWQRRLTFTVGTSATTGMPSTVIWNEIHHKTEFGSNSTGHGYPDPKYFDNVLLELASHGVTEDS